MHWEVWLYSLVPYIEMLCRAIPNVHITVEQRLPLEIPLHSFLLDSSSTPSSEAPLLRFADFGSRAGNGKELSLIDCNAS
jgi:hypothetical protein